MGKKVNYFSNKAIVTRFLNENIQGIVAVVKNIEKPVTQIVLKINQKKP